MIRKEQEWCTGNSVRVTVFRILVVINYILVKVKYYPSTSNSDDILVLD